MNINIRPDGAINRVHVSQNDIGRTLTFNLFNDSLAYTIPNGATVKIQGTKPSGFGFSETCTVSGNTATIDTTETMTDEHGYIETELVIESSGDVLGTSNFILAVEKNPHPSNTTDGTQITAQSLQVQIDELRDEIESGGSGLTDGAKQALLNCLAHVAWIDEDGQDYYDALEDALYPTATLVSISAVYTQGGTVYNTDSLDSLKSDLVVTAHYDDSSTQTVTAYTLSGSLRDNIGTTTITVAYGGKTTTFTVTVTADTSLMYYLYDHHFDGVVGGTSDAINSGIKLTDTDKTFTLLLDADSEGMTSSTYWRLFSGIETTSPYNGFVYGARSVNNNYDGLKWIATSEYQITSFTNAYVGRIRMALTHTSGSGSLAYKIKLDNNTTVSGTVSNAFSAVDVYLYVGGNDNLAWGFKGTMDLFEVYDKILTSSEINTFLGDA